jgi:hypothetical protein
MTIDTMKTPTAVWFQKKVASQQMMIVSAVRSISRDIPSRYQGKVYQTDRQRQTKSHHSPWLRSEYHGNKYSKNTNAGLVGE